MNTKYTKELLEPLIKESKTWAEVCRKLSITVRTGSQSHVKSRAVFFKIDFSHFVGQAHAKGKKGLLSPTRITALDYLNSEKYIKSHKLKIKLIQDGLKEEKCENCGITEWFGESIPFELDHIDNDHFNNELINLKILCPNCHSLKTRKERKKNVIV